MAASREYMNFILEQLSLLDGISHRQMMGEYIIYHHGKIAAYVCDDRLLVKILPASEDLLPGAKREAPYEGAREMLLVERVDEPEFLKELFEAMYPQLPAPKPKRKKSNK